MNCSYRLSTKRQSEFKELSTRWWLYISKGTTLVKYVRMKSAFNFDRFTFNSWLRSLVKDHCKSFFHQSLLGCSTSQIGSRGEMVLKILQRSAIWPRNLTKGYRTPLTYKQSFSKVWIKLGPVKRIYGPNKYFSQSSDMTLTFHPETWFLVVAYPFLKGTLLVKYKLDCGIEGKRKYSPDEDFLNRSAMTLSPVYRK